MGKRKIKTEEQRQKEYGEKQQKIYEKYRKRIVKAREIHNIARIKVIHLESQFDQAQKKAREQFYGAKKKRTAKRKKK